MLKVFRRAKTLYLLASSRAREGEGRVFGSLRLRLDVAPFVQEDLHHAHVASGGGQDERREAWGGGGGVT